MNKGLPNTSKLLARALVLASGYGGVLGWILQKVLGYVLDKASVQLLIAADKVHVAILVKYEGEAWGGAIDEAYGKLNDHLTQEQKDAIDKPVMDAFVKLATFRVRQPDKHT